MIDREEELARKFRIFDATQVDPVLLKLAGENIRGEAKARKSKRAATLVEKESSAVMTGRQTVRQQDLCRHR